MRDMNKYIVLFGKNSIPGTAGTRYEIFDRVSFSGDDIENQMRKYVFKQFYDMGKSAKNLRHDIFCRKRHIVLNDGTIFADSIKIFDHEGSNEYFAFVPSKCFSF